MHGLINRLPSDIFVLLQSLPSFLNVLSMESGVTLMMMMIMMRLTIMMTMTVVVMMTMTRPSDSK